MPPTCLACGLWCSEDRQPNATQSIPSQGFQARARNQGQLRSTGQTPSVFRCVRTGANRADPQPWKHQDSKLEMGDHPVAEAQNACLLREHAACIAVLCCIRTNVSYSPRPADLVPALPHCPSQPAPTHCGNRFDEIRPSPVFGNDWQVRSSAVGLPNIPVSINPSWLPSLGGFQAKDSRALVALVLLIAREEIPVNPFLDSPTPGCSSDWGIEAHAGSQGKGARPTPRTPVSYMEGKRWLGLVGRPPKPTITVLSVSLNCFSVLENMRIRKKCQPPATGRLSQL